MAAGEKPGARAGGRGPEEDHHASDRAVQPEAGPARRCGPVILRRPWVMVWCGVCPCCCFLIVPSRVRWVVCVFEGGSRCEFYSTCTCHKILASKKGKVKSDLGPFLACLSVACDFCMTSNNTVLLVDDICLLVCLLPFPFEGWGCFGQ